MKTLLTSALVVLALTGAAATVSTPSVAASSVTFDFGNVAFGYSDGYWDRNQRWHAWRNQAESRAYRAKYSSHYYGHRHDRGQRKGWRNDRWWDNNDRRDNDRRDNGRRDHR